MGELGRKFRQHMLVCGYAVPAPRPTLRFPEGPRLRLARAAQQTNRARRDPPGARRAAATPAAGGRDRARAHPAPHRNRRHLLPGLRQGTSGLRPRTPPRPRRPRTNLLATSTTALRQRDRTGRGGGAILRHSETDETGAFSAHSGRRECPRTILPACRTALSPTRNGPPVILQTPSRSGPAPARSWRAETRSAKVAPFNGRAREGPVQHLKC